MAVTVIAIHEAIYLANKISSSPSQHGLTV